jgi:hypothetical protein
MTVFRPCLLAGLLALPACGASPPVEPSRAVSAPSATPGTGTGGSRAGRSPAIGTANPASASPVLERSYTGQERPTLVVHNAYPRPQHLFVDWLPVGAIDPGGTGTFELTVGVHTVTSSDSADPNDNGSSLTEDFGRGYAYRYQIVAK